MTRWLTPDEERAVVEAIASAERRTTAEIRVHIETTCDGDPMAEARSWFLRLGMERTEARNGVLLYVAVRDRVFAIFGDEGVHRVVGGPFWEDVRGALEGRFRSGLHAQGLVAAIAAIGERLAAAFPSPDGGGDELTDDVSYGSR